MTTSTIRSALPMLSRMKLKAPGLEEKLETRSISDPCMDMWLNNVSAIEFADGIQNDDDNDNSSCGNDDEDNRIIMALNDYLVADEFGSIGRSKKCLAKRGIDDCHAFMTAVDDDAKGSECSFEEETMDEDMVLQSVLLESMVSAKQEELRTFEGARELQLDDEVLDDSGEIVLTKNWADIELDEDEQDEAFTRDVPQMKPKPSSLCSKVDVRKSSTTSSSDAFECPWTAWYDPPKRVDARLGIATHAYEQNLFEMGTIQYLEDFWTVHDMVDWTNMPSCSMVSFSRVGSKAIWEDPMHCHGGRWIIRGFPRSKSEALYTQIVLSVFLGHFPDSDEFTCITLQVKEKRRGNAIQLWTRSLDYAHVDEMQEHISCLIREDDSEDEIRPSKSKRRRRQKKGRPSPSKQLHFEFCPNSDSIERNAVKLAEPVVPGDSTVRSAKRLRKIGEATMASRCHTVAEMYTKNRSRKCKSKVAEKKFNGKKACAKIDWSDALLRMGSGRFGGVTSKINEVESISPESLCVTSTTPKAYEILHTNDELTPSKLSCNKTSAAIKSESQIPLAALKCKAVRTDDKDSNEAAPTNAGTKIERPSNEDWRCSSARQHTSLKSSTTWNRSKKRWNKEEAEEYNDWRRSNAKVTTKSTPFVEAADLECLNEEPIFVEYDPKLVGLGGWQKPHGAQNHYLTQCGWGLATAAGGWAPFYANSRCINFESTTGTFDSHGCWYPPVTSSQVGLNSVECGEINPDGFASTNTSADAASMAPSLSGPGVSNVARGDKQHINDDTCIESIKHLGNYSNTVDVCDAMLSQRGPWQLQSSQYQWGQGCPAYGGDENFYCSQEQYHAYSNHSSEISRLADSVAGIKL